MKSTRTAYVIEFVNEEKKPYCWFVSHNNQFEKTLIFDYAKVFSEKITAEKALKKLLKTTKTSRPYLKEFTRISEIKITMEYGH